MKNISAKIQIEDHFSTAKNVGGFIIRRHFVQNSNSHGISLISEVSVTKKIEFEIMNVNDRLYVVSLFE